MNNTSKFLIALAAALAMPAAFAQDATTAGQDSTQAAPPTQQAQPAEQAQPQQTTWADLDADKDGSLSKAEAANVPALAADFDKADANGDGKLSPDEYRAFAAAKNGDTQEQK